MRGHPPGNDRRNALEYLVEGISVGRENTAGGLVGSKPVLGLDLANDEAIETSEFLSTRPRSMCMGFWIRSATLAAVASARIKGLDTIRLIGTSARLSAAAWA
jgi:hypothetical protein